MHGTNNEQANGRGPQTRQPPPTFLGDLANLPPALDQLKGEQRWCLWKWKFAGIDANTGEEKWTKTPHQASGHLAKVNELTTWSTYAEVIAALGRGGFDGIGFCRSKSKIAAFDVDKCRDPASGLLKPYAQELMQRAGSYAEVTPSGTGIRIIGLTNGTSGGDKGRKQEAPDGVSVESYRKTNRYITITGLSIGATTLVDIDALMDATVRELDELKAQRGRNGQGASEARSEPYGELSEQLKEMLNITDPGAGNPCGDHASRSEFFFAFVCGCLRERVADEKITAACLDASRAGKAIFEHVKDQPAGYMKVQIEKAKKQVAENFELFNRRIKKDSQHNIRLTIKKMGAELSYNVFTDQYVMEMNATKKIVNDAAVDDIWAAIDRKFNVLFEKSLFYDILRVVARESSFHPVKEHLSKLQWDNKKRLDTWLIDYCSAEDTKFNRAVGKIMLVAAVRRVMSPGCKFDEIVILEGPQGRGKSTLLTALAMKQEWFTDTVPIDGDSKKFIEQLRGKLIAELSELGSMRKTDVEHVKTMASRQVDRSRMAYGRIVEEVPRQFIIVGTTNSSEYLMDLTGNRRFWPVKTDIIKVDEFTKIVDQLWAEAVQLEAQGMSIRLDEKLWGDATAVQAGRTTPDPWVDLLDEALGDIKGKINNKDAFVIVNVSEDRQNQANSKRLADCMKFIGFEHTSVRFDGKKGRGYVRGTKAEQEKQIVVARTGDVVTTGHSQAAAEAAARTANDEIPF